MEQHDLFKLIQKLSWRLERLEKVVTLQQQQIQSLRKSQRHMKSRDDNAQGQLNTLTHSLRKI